MVWAKAFCPECNVTYTFECSPNFDRVILCSHGVSLPVELMDEAPPVSAEAIARSERHARFVPMRSYPGQKPTAELQPSPTPLPPVKGEIGPFWDEKSAIAAAIEPYILALRELPTWDYSAVYDSGLYSAGEGGVWYLSTDVDALAEKLSVPAWQPIETAPKDGTRVIGLDEFDNVEIIRYNPDPTEPDPWQYSHHYNEDHECFTPVAWQPLPAVPTKATQR